ncbi:MAG TPA: hypothetical protein VFN10_01560, partial [Thermoanaerobaculia bacterium]|nr:hypothetical protein [Thermoanaerobaculia bacterium]
MKRIVLFALFAAALALSLAAQDVMTAGSSSAPAGAAVRIPIYLRDVSGTPLGVDAGAGKRIQGISLAAKLSPASAPLSFEPSGVLPGPTPLFAQTSPITGGVAYLGAFSETTAPL